MTNHLMKGDVPVHLQGFHAALLTQVETLFRDLPCGAARLTISPIPGHPDWPEPYFEVVPTNPRSAALKCAAAATDLDLTIGHSWRELYGFARGGTVLQGLSWQEEFCGIWLAVVAGRFTEHLFFDSRDKVIAWDSRLVLKGRELVLRNGRREKLVGRAYTREEVVKYEPYVIAR